MHLIAPKDLKETLPISARAQAYVSKSRQTLIEIFERQDPRLLVVVGPCSIHCVEEGLQYARQLKQLSEQVKESCFLIMRAYVEKPRSCIGWKGLAHDPYLNGSEDLEKGLALARHFLIQLAEIGVPAATEFLTPNLTPYVKDLITWGCIGARTSASQIHRLLASHLSMPVGFKNSVDGNVQSAIDGVMVAKQSHTFMHINEQGSISRVKSTGNPHAHLVLRGSIEKTNYDSDSIQHALETLRCFEFPPRVLVDCSHGNCQKQYFKQKEVFQNVLEQFQDGNHQILGMMLESNLEASAQKIPSQLGELQPGVSITDPCLDFSTTAELISSVSVMSLTHS